MEHSDKLVIFQEKEIRRVWHNEEWWFSVLDVIEVLAETVNATDYFKKMRKRDEGLKTFVGTNCPQVLMENKDGNERKTLAANTEGLFRIVQSVPSPKAEPFKLWLAKVGYERILEIENPELAAERARQNYKDLGYDDAWIEKRMQSIAIRGELTDEWGNRGVKAGQEYAILTAEISKATFGLTPTEHKNLKDLKRENLRDHMTNLELIFTMLGEETVRRGAVKKDAQGFIKNKEVAIEGGIAAGDALQAYEKRTGENVVTPENFKARIQVARSQQKVMAPPKNDTPTLTTEEMEK